MEFKFPVNEVLKQPLVEISHNMIPPGFTGDRRTLWDTMSKVSEIVNAMGEASASAQGLTKPITTSERLRNSEHKIYLLVDKSAGNGRGAVTGMLKTGKKGLYVFDRNGQHYQVSPPCVLDFYVHESRQRNGLGKRLFEHMLQKEEVEPVKMAIDRPSDKFLGFLNKHYSLNGPIKQMNNYVVFDGFFPNTPEKNSSPVDTSSLRTSSNPENSNQQMFASYNSPNEATNTTPYIPNMYYQAPNVQGIQQQELYPTQPQNQQFYEAPGVATCANNYQQIPNYQGAGEQVYDNQPQQVAQYGPNQQYAQNVQPTAQYAPSIFQMHNQQAQQNAQLISNAGNQPAQNVVGAQHLQSSTQNNMQQYAQSTVPIARNVERQTQDVYGMNGGASTVQMQGQNSQYPVQQLTQSLGNMQVSQHNPQPSHSPILQVPQYPQGHAERGGNEVQRTPQANEQYSTVARPNTQSSPYHQPSVSGDARPVAMTNSAQNVSIPQQQQQTHQPGAAGEAAQSTGPSVQFPQSQVPLVQTHQQYMTAAQPQGIVTDQQRDQQYAAAVSAQMPVQQTHQQYTTPVAPQTAVAAHVESVTQIQPHMHQQAHQQHGSNEAGAPQIQPQVTGASAMVSQSKTQLQQSQETDLRNVPQIQQQMHQQNESAVAAAIQPTHAAGASARMSQSRMQLQQIQQQLEASRVPSSSHIQPQVQQQAHQHYGTTGATGQIVPQQVTGVIAQPSQSQAQLSQRNQHLEAPRIPSVSQIQPQTPQQTHQQYGTGYQQPATINVPTNQQYAAPLVGSTPQLQQSYQQYSNAQPNPYAAAPQQLTSEQNAGQNIPDQQQIGYPAYVNQQYQQPPQATVSQPNMQQQTNQQHVVNQANVTQSRPNISVGFYSESENAGSLPGHRLNQRNERPVSAVTAKGTSRNDEAEQHDLKHGYPSQISEVQSVAAVEEKVTLSPKLERPRSLSIQLSEEQVDEKTQNGVTGKVQPPDEIVEIEEEVEKLSVGNYEPPVEDKNEDDIKSPPSKPSHLTEQGFFDLKFYHNKLW